MFNVLRYVVRAGCPWRLLPNDLPPWQIVHQQATRWLEAGGFEAMIHDLRMILRLAVKRPEQPTAAVLDARTQADTDYKRLSGTVTIPAGAAKAKIKLLPAIDGSYTLGTATTAKIKISGDD